MAGCARGRGRRRSPRRSGSSWKRRSNRLLRDLAIEVLQQLASYLRLVIEVGAVDRVHRSILMELDVVLVDDDLVRLARQGELDHHGRLWGSASGSLARTLREVGADVAAFQEGEQA